jgi:tetratricopeptide (TPR) repeat protein
MCVSAWVAVGLACGMLFIATSAGAADLRQVLDGFLAAVAKSNATVEQKAVVAEIVGQLRQRPERRAAAITESLGVLYPEFKAALAALGDDHRDLTGAIAALTRLRESADPYLAAEAAFHLARANLFSERFEEALPQLGDLQRKWADQTAHGSEALFLRGIAEAALLRHQAALSSLEQFLASDPEAPEKMRAAAVRQIARLKQYHEGTLSDIQQRMDYSRRKLALDDTGADTRRQQEQVIDHLTVLIHESEDREAEGSGSSAAAVQAPGQSPGEAGAAASQNPSAGSPSSPTGGGREGRDSDRVERLRHGGPQSPWSRLRDKDRDPVFSAIKEKFPARYQQLIEQYYQSFQDDSP